MKAIKANRIRCRKCGAILESKYTHDFQQCECGNFVDGGKEYIRIGGDMDFIEVMTEYEDVPGYYVTYYSMFGYHNTFETTKDINRVINYYEEQGNYLIVENEKHEEIYRTQGLDRIIAATDNGALMPAT